MKRVNVSGAKRMMQLGMKQVQLWLDGKEIAALDARRAETRNPRAKEIRKILCEALGLKFYRS